MLDKALNRFTRRHPSQTRKADAVILKEAVIVFRMLKCQCQQALFLQVRLVNAREASSQHGHTAKQAW